MKTVEKSKGVKIRLEYNQQAHDFYMTRTNIFKVLQKH